MNNRQLNTVINFRVSENDKQQLENYSAITQLSASFFMREALRLLHEQVRSANEELPEFVEQAFLEMDERKKIHVLKVLRVLAYRKMACVEWIRRIEWAKPFRASGNEPDPTQRPPIKYMVLLSMSDGVFDAYERTQHELLVIVTERERTYENTSNTEKANNHNPKQQIYTETE